jgi:hypothetical protein
MLAFLNMQTDKKIEVVLKKLKIDQAQTRISYEALLLFSMPYI